jgi:hypothetical protein
MKNNRGQEIRVLKEDYFKETINSPERVERVMNELKGSPEIINGQIVVNYSDEGFACFEVILNLHHVLLLSFMSTAS